jgi:hypothetical protein
MAPPGSIGSSLSHLKYVKHLIDRYHEFAKQQPGRKFAFPAIYSAIKKDYGAKWDLIALHQFEDLSIYLQRKVDRTRQGSINRGKGIRNYSTFDEYRQKYESRGK